MLVTKHNFINDIGAILVMFGRHISDYISTLLPLLCMKINRKYSKM